MLLEEYQRYTYIVFEKTDLETTVYISSFSVAFSVLYFSYTLKLGEYKIGKTSHTISMNCLINCH